MENNSLKNISLEVKNARKLASLTQEDLALFSGVSRKFISDLENEKQTLEIGKVLIVLAALGITWVLFNKVKGE